MGAISTENSFFVAFAENEDEVAFFSVLESKFDSVAAIRDFEEVLV